MTIWLEDGLKNQDQSVETTSGNLVTPSESHSDDIWKFVTPSGLAVIKESIETLAWRRQDTTSVIDYYLGSVVFGKPFVKKTRLIYDKEEGTILFKKGNEKIVFKMPHKMEMFKHVDFKDINTDCISPFVVEGDDDSHKETHYSDSLNLGPEYKYYESVSESIRGLMRMKSMRKNQGGVTYGKGFRD
ncbi:hypothetical protein Tco_0284987 [Tanacetum coccineum]